MSFYTTTLLAALAASASAAQDSRTFAVNHFYGVGALTEGRMDPIVSPGEASVHAHTIQGGNAFALTLSDTALLSSTCTSSLIKNDKSVYWTPKMYFQDPKNGSLISVPLFYMNVYYFFEATDDDIVAFEPGHRMFVGDVELRTPPASGGGSITDANAGTPQPIQFTCPRTSYDPPSYPADSDGLHGCGMQDPNNKGAGAGFPDQNCDGYASPLRADVHFPSCYNPAAGLDDYKNNMVWPSSAGTTDGKQNCPEGYVHTPHIFYEVYWNTPPFADLWTPGQCNQPFVLANGDKTGYSLHADFISGWDKPTLQQIIDNCDAGDSGMDQCPGLIGGVNDPSTSCNIADLIQEQVNGIFTALPGNNPITGFGSNVTSPAPAASASVAAPASSSPSVPAVSAGTAPATTGSGGDGYGDSVSTATSSPAAASSPAGGNNEVVSAVASSSPSTSTPTTAPASSPPSSPPSSGSGATGNATAPAGWTYSGCYSDFTNPRVLTGIQFADLGIGKVTTTGCIKYCGSQGYSIAGTEYAGQCFCGNSLASTSTLQPESECDMECEGDHSQVCGGSLTLSVYSNGTTTTSGSASPSSTSDSSGSWRRHLQDHMNHNAHVRRSFKA